MKFFLAATILGAVSAAAQSIVVSQLPTCVQTCFNSTRSTTCSATNLACLCSDQTYAIAFSACIQSGCASAELSASIASFQQNCANAQVITSNGQVVPAPTTGSGPGGTTTLVYVSSAVIGPNTRTTSTTSVSASASSSTSRASTSTVTSSSSSALAASGSASASTSRSSGGAVPTGRVGGAAVAAVLGAVGAALML